jgi:hypothetical protein
MICSYELRGGAERLNVNLVLWTTRGFVSLNFPKGNLDSSPLAGATNTQ